MSNEPLLNVRRVNSISVVEFGDRCKLIEDAILEPIGSELLQAARTAQSPRLILDLSRTTFFGSGFLEVLLRTWKELQQRPDARMVLCGVQTYCREVLEITHLDQLWPLIDNCEAAVKQLEA